MKILSAENPAFVTPDHSIIHLAVKFDHLPEPVPFAASASDCEEHGRDLFARALAGEFGEVLPYTRPKETPAQVSHRLKEKAKAYLARRQGPGRG